MKDILKELDNDIRKHDDSFKKAGEEIRKKIAKDPNEFFLDIPSKPMKAPKNNTNQNFKMQDFLESILNESDSNVWFHGSQHKFDKFDLKYCFVDEGDKKSNAQYGPGFYLTQSYKEALSYSEKDGYVYELDLTKNNIKNAKDKPSNKLTTIALNYLYKDKERTELILSNWDENKNIAKKQLIEAINNADSLGEQVINIWNECYVNREIDFCKMMSTFCDGVLFDRNFEFLDIVTPCLVIYDPNSVKFIKTISKKDL